MRKAGDSKIYPRNSNAILISLKSYDHREVGGRSYALRWEAAGKVEGAGWATDHVVLQDLSV